MLAAPGLLAACGGNGSESVDEILAKTFDPGTTISSGRLALNVTADLEGVKGLEDPVGLKLSGPFQSSGAKKLPTFALDLSISAGGQSFTAGATATSNAAFIEFGGTTYSVPAEIFRDFKQGYEQAAARDGDEKQSGITFESLGIRPRAWLADARKAGTVDVGGAETTHITAKIDVAKFVDDLDRILARAGSLGVTKERKADGLSAIEKLAVQQAIRSSAVGVYSGVDDRILRRLTVRVELDVPEEARSRASGLRAGTLRFDLLLADVNQDQRVSAPAGPTRPLSELLARFGLGSSGGGGSDGSGQDAPAAPTTPDASREYLDCLEKAGQDLAKVQECASLLK
jgi:hypothetical protein